MPVVVEVFALFVLARQLEGRSYDSRSGVFDTLVAFGESLSRYLEKLNRTLAEYIMCLMTRLTLN